MTLVPIPVLSSHVFIQHSTFNNSQELRSLPSSLLGAHRCSLKHHTIFPQHLPIQFILKLFTSRNGIYSRARLYIFYLLYTAHIPNTANTTIATFAHDTTILNITGVKQRRNSPNDKTSVQVTSTRAMGAIERPFQ